VSLAKDSSGDGRRDTWRKGAEREEIGEGEVKRSTKTDIQYSIFDIRYSIFNCLPFTVQSSNVEISLAAHACMHVLSA
jgi:hypothetical protein